MIELSAGFLCERWCSAYRLLNLFLNPPEGFSQYQIVGASPPHTPFQWPEDLPDPICADNQTGQALRAVYKHVIEATILHEVGHAVKEAMAAPKPEVELACDAYALEYLLGDTITRDREIFALGAAIWLCCICAESLLYTEMEISTHPNPIDRMERLTSKYLATRPDSEQLSAIYTLCVGQEVVLARARRPYQCDLALSKHRGDIAALSRELRRCW